MPEETLIPAPTKTTTFFLPSRSLITDENPSLKIESFDIFFEVTSRSENGGRAMVNDLLFRIEG